MFGFWVYGLGCRVQGLGFRILVQGFGFGARAEGRTGIPSTLNSKGFGTPVEIIISAKY